MKLKWVTKSFACLTCFFYFVSQECAYPAEIHRLSLAPQSPESHFSPAAVFSIPPEWGSIQELHGNTPQVVLIQDAHGRYEAQKNTASILDFLNRKQGIASLYLEGGSGKLEPERLQFFNEPQFNKMAVDLLARESEAGGAEIFLVGQRHLISAFGLEDPNLYLQNFEAFQKVTRARPVAEKFLEQELSAIRQESGRLFGADLKAFFKEWMNYESSQDLARFLNPLESQARKKLEIDLNDPRHQLQWPQLIRFFELKKREPKLQPDKAKEELKRLSEWSKRAGLAKPFIEYLLAESSPQALRRGSPTPAFPPKADQPLAGGDDIKTDSPFTSLRHFWESFYEAAHPRGFAFEQFPNLVIYEGYQILQQEIDSQNLFDEINQLAQTIFEKLARNQKEKDLIERTHRYFLLKKLFHLQLTRKEFKELEKTLAEPEKKVVILNVVKDLRAAFKTARLFYFLALKRDKTMQHIILNDWSARQNSGGSAFGGKNLQPPRSFSAKRRRIRMTTDAGLTVLITGGFHTEALVSAMKQKGISYAVVSPHFSETGTDEKYIAAMMGTKPKLDFDAVSDLSFPHDVSETALLRGRRESKTLMQSTWMSPFTGLSKPRRSEIRSQIEKWGLDHGATLRSKPSRSEAPNDYSAESFFREIDAEYLKAIYREVFSSIEDPAVFVPSSGPDISSILLSSNATTAILADILPFGDSSKEISEAQIEKYFVGKKERTHGETVFLKSLEQLRELVILELTRSGASFDPERDIVQDPANPDIYHVHFEWAHPLDGIKKKREFIFVGNVDLKKTTREDLGNWFQKLPASKKSKIDGVILKAPDFLREKRKFGGITPERLFFEKIRPYLRKGGKIVTDIFLYDFQRFKLKERKIPALEKLEEDGAQFGYPPGILGVPSLKKGAFIYQVLGSPRSEARKSTAINLSAVSNAQNQNALTLPIKNHAVIAHAETESRGLSARQPVSINQRIGLAQVILNFLKDSLSKIGRKFEEDPFRLAGKIIADHYLLPVLRLTSVPATRPDFLERSSPAKNSGLNASTSSSISSSIPRSSTMPNVLPRESTSRTMPLRRKGSFDSPARFSIQTVSSDKPLRRETMFIPPDKAKYSTLPASGRNANFGAESSRSEARTNKMPETEFVKGWTDLLMRSIQEQVIWKSFEDSEGQKRKIKVLKEKEDASGSDSSLKSFHYGLKYMLGWEKRKPDWFPTDFSLRRPKPEELGEIVDRLRIAWKNEKLEPGLGTFNQQLILTLLGFISDANEFLNRQTLISGLIRGSLEDRLWAWWLSAVQKIYHLRYQGMHFEKNREEKWTAFDNEIMIRIAHQLIPLYLTWKKEHHGDPDFQRSDAILRWGLTVFQDLRVHGVSFQNRGQEEIEGFTNPYNIFKTDDESISYYVSRIFDNLKQADSKGVLTDKPLPAGEVEDLLAGLLAKTEEDWTNNPLGWKYQRRDNYSPWFEVGFASPWKGADGFPDLETFEQLLRRFENLGEGFKILTHPQTIFDRQVNPNHLVVSRFFFNKIYLESGIDFARDKFLMPAVLGKIPGFREKMNAALHIPEKRMAVFAQFAPYAIPIMERILRTGRHKIAGIVTSPKPEPAITQFAQENKIPVLLMPEKSEGSGLRHFIQTLEGKQADIALIAGAEALPAEILGMSKMKFLTVFPPESSGMADKLPFVRALLSRKYEWQLSVSASTQKGSGSVLNQIPKLPILFKESSSDFIRRTAPMAAWLVHRTVDELALGSNLKLSGRSRPRISEQFRGAPLTETWKIDWNLMDREIDQRVRAWHFDDFRAKTLIGKKWIEIESAQFFWDKEKQFSKKDPPGKIVAKISDDTFLVKTRDGHLQVQFVMDPIAKRELYTGKILESPRSEARSNQNAPRAEVRTAESQGPRNTQEILNLTLEDLEDISLFQNIQIEFAKKWRGKDTFTEEQKRNVKEWVLKTFLFLSARVKDRTLLVESVLKELPPVEDIRQDNRVELLFYAGFLIGFVGIQVKLIEFVIEGARIFKPLRYFAGFLALVLFVPIFNFARLLIQGLRGKGLNLGALVEREIFTSKRDWISLNPKLPLPRLISVTVHEVTHFILKKIKSPVYADAASTLEWFLSRDVSKYTEASPFFLWHARFFFGRGQRYATEYLTHAMEAREFERELQIFWSKQGIVFEESQKADESYHSGEFLAGLLQGTEAILRERGVSEAEILEKSSDLLFKAIYGTKNDLLGAFESLRVPPSTSASSSRSEARSNARIVFDQMKNDPDHFEEALDEVREYLEKENLPWHGIRMVWKILRKYNQGGKLSADFTAQSSGVIQEIEDAILQEKFWQAYLELDKGKKEGEPVNLSLLRETLSGKLTDEEFERAIRREEGKGNIERVQDSIRANFTQLGDEAVRNIGLNQPKEILYRNIAYPVPSPREVFTQEMSAGLTVSGMTTYFARNGDEIYRRVKRFSVSQLKQGVAKEKGLKIIVIGSSYGMQGYDVAMAAAEAMREIKVKAPIQVVITDGQYASIDDGKKGKFHRSDFGRRKSRFKQFFKQEGDRLPILSTRLFRETWGIELAFEKLDILDESDVHRLLHERGPYDLVVAENVHFQRSYITKEERKSVHVKFFSHLENLLSDKGQVFYSFDQKRPQPQKAFEYLVRFYNENFRLVGEHDFFENELTFFYGLRHKTTVQIKRAIEKTFDDRVLNRKNMENLMLAVIIDHEWPQEKKMEIFLFLLDLLAKKGGVDRRRRLEKDSQGEILEMFTHWDSLTEAAQRTIAKFIRENIESVHATLKTAGIVRSEARAGIERPVPSYFRNPNFVAKLFGPDSPLDERETQVLQDTVMRQVQNQKPVSMNVIKKYPLFEVTLERTRVIYHGAMKKAKELYSGSQGFLRPELLEPESRDIDFRHPLDLENFTTSIFRALDQMELLLKPGPHPVKDLLRTNLRNVRDHLANKDFREAYSFMTHISYFARKDERAKTLFKSRKGNQDLFKKQAAAILADFKKVVDDENEFEIQKALPELRETARFFLKDEEVQMFQPFVQVRENGGVIKIYLQNAWRMNWHPSRAYAGFRISAIGRIEKVERGLYVINAFESNRKVGKVEKIYISADPKPSRNPKELLPMAEEVLRYEKRSNDWQDGILEAAFQNIWKRKSGNAAFAAARSKLAGPSLSEAAELLLNILQSENPELTIGPGGKSFRVSYQSQPGVETIYHLVGPTNFEFPYEFRPYKIRNNKLEEGSTQGTWAPARTIKEYFHVRSEARASAELRNEPLTGDSLAILKEQGVGKVEVEGYPELFDWNTFEAQIWPQLKKIIEPPFNQEFWLLIRADKTAVITQIRKRSEREKLEDAQKDLFALNYPSLSALSGLYPESGAGKTVGPSSLAGYEEGVRTSLARLILYLNDLREAMPALGGKDQRVAAIYPLAILINEILKDNPRFLTPFLTEKISGILALQTPKDQEAAKIRFSLNPAAGIRGELFYPEQDVSVNYGVLGVKADAYPDQTVIRKRYEELLTGKIRGTVDLLAAVDVTIVHPHTRKPIIAAPLNVELKSALLDFFILLEYSTQPKVTAEQISQAVSALNGLLALYPQILTSESKKFLTGVMKEASLYHFNGENFYLSERTRQILKAIPWIRKIHDEGKAAGIPVSEMPDVVEAIQANVRSRELIFPFKQISGGSYLVLLHSMEKSSPVVTPVSDLNQLKQFMDQAAGLFSVLAKAGQAPQQKVIIEIQEDPGGAAGRVIIRFVSPKMEDSKKETLQWLSHQTTDERFVFEIELDAGEEGQLVIKKYPLDPEPFFSARSEARSENESEPVQKDQEKQIIRLDSMLAIRAMIRLHDKIELHAPPTPVYRPFLNIRQAKPEEVAANPAFQLLSIAADYLKDKAKEAGAAEIVERMDRFKTSTSWVEVDMPTRFFPPGENTIFAQILRISLKDGTFYISKKAGQELMPMSKARRAFIAYILNSYQAYFDFFHLPENQGKSLEEIRTKLRSKQSAEHEIFIRQILFSDIPKEELSEEKENFKKIAEEDKAFLKQYEEKLLEREARIRDSATKLQKALEQLPHKNPELTRENLKETARDLLDVALYYQSRGMLDQTVAYYRQAIVMYKGIQIIDADGVAEILPLQLQYEMLFFLLHGGLFDEFLKEFNALTMGQDFPRPLTPAEEVHLKNWVPRWLKKGIPELLHQLDVFAIAAMNENDRTKLGQIRERLQEVYNSPDFLRSESRSTDQDSLERESIPGLFERNITVKADMEKLASVYRAISPLKEAPLTDDDLAHMLMGLNSAELPAGLRLSVLKTVAQKAGIADEEVIASFASEELYRSLYLKMHPYVRKAEAERKSFITLSMEHDYVYHQVKTIIKQGVSPKTLVVVNVDPHDDMSKMPIWGNVVLPGNWGSALLTDGLAAAYIQIELHGVNGQPEFFLSTMKDGKLMVVKKISQNEFMHWIHANNVVHTVDADAFSLKQDGAFEEYAKGYHYDEKETKTMIEQVNRYFQLVKKPPIRVSLITSPAFLNPRAMENGGQWLYQWKDWLIEAYTPMFKTSTAPKTGKSKALDLKATFLQDLKEHGIAFFQLENAPQRYDLSSSDGQQKLSSLVQLMQQPYFDATKKLILVLNTPEKGMATVKQVARSEARTAGLETIERIFEGAEAVEKLIQWELKQLEENKITASPAAIEEDLRSLMETTSKEQLMKMLAEGEQPMEQAVADFTPLTQAILFRWHLDRKGLVIQAMNQTEKFIKDEFPGLTPEAHREFNFVPGPFLDGTYQITLRFPGKKNRPGNEKFLKIALAYNSNKLPNYHAIIFYELNPQNLAKGQKSSFPRKLMDVKIKNIASLQNGIKALLNAVEEKHPRLGNHFPRRSEARVGENQEGAGELKGRILEKPRAEVSETVLTLKNVKEGGPDVELRPFASGNRSFSVEVFVGGKKTGQFGFFLDNYSGEKLLRMSSVFPVGDEGDAIQKQFANKGIMSTILNWLAWEAAGQGLVMGNSGTASLSLIKLYFKFFAETSYQNKQQKNTMDLLEKYGFYSEKLFGVLELEKNGKWPIGTGLALEKIQDTSIGERYRITRVKSIYYNDGYKIKSPFESGQVISIGGQGQIRRVSPEGMEEETPYVLNHTLSNIVVEGRPRNFVTPRGTVSFARSEMRTDALERERKITQLVLDIGTMEFDEMDPKALKNRVRKLNGFLEDNSSPMDVTTVYTAFVFHRGIKDFSVLYDHKTDEVKLTLPHDTPEIENDLIRFLDRLGMVGQKGSRLRLHETLVNTMVLALVHPSQKVRFAAVRALLALPEDQRNTVAPVLDKMAKDSLSGPFVVYSLIGLFEKYKDTPALVRLLKSPKTPKFLRQKAIKALGQIGQDEKKGKEAIQALIDTIFDFNTDPSILIQAINELAKNGPPDMAALTLAALIMKSDKTISQAAENAFSSLGSRVDRLLKEKRSQKPRSEARAWKVPDDFRETIPPGVYPSFLLFKPAQGQYQKGLLERELNLPGDEERLKSLKNFREAIKILQAREYGFTKKIINLQDLLTEVSVTRKLENEVDLAGRIDKVDALAQGIEHAVSILRKNYAIGAKKDFLKKGGEFMALISKNGGEDFIEVFNALDANLADEKQTQKNLEELGEFSGALYQIARALRELYDYAGAEKAVKMMNSTMKYLESISSKSRGIVIADELKKIKERMTGVGMDLPMFFFPGAKDQSPKDIRRIIQISFRREAGTFSSKLLRALDPADPLHQAIAAFHLLAANHLMDLYQHMVKEFDYETPARRGVVFHDIDKRIDRELQSGKFAVRILNALGIDDSRMADVFKELMEKDRLLRLQEGKRLERLQRKLAKDVEWILKTGVGEWDENGSEEKITRLSNSLNRRISTHFQNQYPNPKGTDDTQAHAISILTSMILDLQKIAFSRQDRPWESGRLPVYNLIVELYKVFHKVDMIGLFPMKIQIEMMYFLLRSGNLPRFEEEWDRLLSADFTPSSMRVRQRNIQGVIEKEKNQWVPEPHGQLSQWLENGLPAMLFLLQQYRPYFNKSEEAMQTINRVEKKLEDTLRVIRSNRKFEADLTTTAKTELLHPLLVSVQGRAEREDVGFVWRKEEGKDEETGGRKIHVQVEAHRQAVGGRREVIGFLNFSLSIDDEQNPAVIQSYADPENLFTKKTKRRSDVYLEMDPVSQKTKSALWIAKDHRDIKKSLGNALMVLALRLAAKSGAETFNVTQIPQLLIAGKKSKPAIGGLQGEMGERVSTQQIELKTEARSEARAAVERTAAGLGPHQQVRSEARMKNAVPDWDEDYAYRPHLLFENRKILKERSLAGLKESGRISDAEYQLFNALEKSRGIDLKVQERENHPVLRKLLDKGLIYPALDGSLIPVYWIETVEEIPLERRPKMLRALFDGELLKHESGVSPGISSDLVIEYFDHRGDDRRVLLVSLKGTAPFVFKYTHIHERAIEEQFEMARQVLKYKEKIKMGERIYQATQSPFDHEASPVIRPGHFVEIDGTEIFTEEFIDGPTRRDLTNFLENEKGMGHDAVQAILSRIEGHSLSQIWASASHKDSFLETGFSGRGPVLEDLHGQNVKYVKTKNGVIAKYFDFERFKNGVEPSAAFSNYMQNRDLPFLNHPFFILGWAEGLGAKGSYEFFRRFKFQEEDQLGVLLQLLQATREVLDAGGKVSYYKEIPSEKFEEDQNEFFGLIYGILADDKNLRIPDSEEKIRKALIYGLAPNPVFSGSVQPLAEALARIFFQAQQGKYGNHLDRFISDLAEIRTQAISTKKVFPHFEAPPRSEARAVRRLTIENLRNFVKEEVQTPEFDGVLPEDLPSVSGGKKVFYIDADEKFLSWINRIEMKLKDRFGDRYEIKQVPVDGGGNFKILGYRLEITKKPARSEARSASLELRRTVQRAEMFAVNSDSILEVSVKMTSGILGLGLKGIRAIFARLYPDVFAPKEIINRKERAKMVSGYARLLLSGAVVVMPAKLLLGLSDKARVEYLSMIYESMKSSPSGGKDFARIIFAGEGAGKLKEKISADHPVILRPEAEESKGRSSAEQSFRIATLRMTQWHEVFQVKQQKELMAAHDQKNRPVSVSFIETIDHAVDSGIPSLLLPSDEIEKLSEERRFEYLNKLTQLQLLVAQELKTPLKGEALKIALIRLLRNKLNIEFDIKNGFLSPSTGSLLSADLTQAIAAMKLTSKAA